MQLLSCLDSFRMKIYGVQVLLVSNHKLHRSHRKKRDILQYFISSHSPNFSPNYIIILSLIQALHKEY